MKVWLQFWQDDGGAVLTAETVMVGSVAVVGGMVGLNTAAKAVDAELKDYASAIRSLDQSYGFTGQQSCQAWTAGSYFHQQRVDEALVDLCAEGTADPALIKDHVDAQRAAAVPSIISGPADTAPANQLPQAEPEKKPEPKPKKKKDKDEDSSI